MDKRTIKLKTSLQLKDQSTQKSHKEVVHLNFNSMGDDKPTAEDYGVQEEAHKTKLNEVLEYLGQIDEPFFKWLETDAQNAILFANDPLKALKMAIPDLDESVFDGLNKNIFI